MQYKRSNFLLMISMGLILVSFISLIIWGYQKYFSTEPDTKKMNTGSAVITDTLPVNTAEASPGTETDSFPAEQQPVNPSPQEPFTAEDSLAEMKQEVADLMNSSKTDAELRNALNQINQLNQKIKALENRNSSIEEENRKLQATVEKISKIKTTAVSVPDKKTETKKEKKSVDNTQGSSTRTVISAISLGAFYTKGNDEVKTNEAGRTEKFSGSLLYKNTANPTGEETEVFLVVYRPDGKLLNSGWETGTFSTPQGKMNYTTRLRFDCAPGESRKVGFSIYADRYQKGRYKLYAYINGKLSGTAVKSLY